MGFLGIAVSCLVADDVFHVLSSELEVKPCFQVSAISVVLNESFTIFP